MRAPVIQVPGARLDHLDQTARYRSIPSTRLKVLGTRSTTGTHGSKSRTKQLGGHPYRLAPSLETLHPLIDVPLPHQWVPKASPRTSVPRARSKVLAPSLLLSALRSDLGFWACRSRLRPHGFWNLDPCRSARYTLYARVHLGRFAVGSRPNRTSAIKRMRVWMLRFRVRESYLRLLSPPLSDV